MAWHDARYIMGTMAQVHGRTLELLLHRPGGFDDHQDVFAYRRA